MASQAEPSVDIYLVSSGSSYGLATDFPVLALKRICERFTDQFADRKQHTIKPISRTRFE
jgi:hypothetical protein